MDDKFYQCKKCSNGLMYLKENGPHIGLYCSAGHFIAWINKKTIQANTEEAPRTDRCQALFTDDLHVEDNNDDMPWRD